MTLVKAFLTDPAADGSLVPAKGALQFAPTARRVVTGTPDSVVLPSRFQVRLEDGAANVTLAPNDLTWLWRIDEHISGQPARTVYVNVPDVAEVDYTDLVSIDPDTLTPAPSPNPAWLAPFEDLEARLDAGVIAPDPDDPGFFLIGA